MVLWGALFSLFIMVLSLGCYKQGLGHLGTQLLARRSLSGLNFSLVFSSRQDWQSGLGRSPEIHSRKGAGCRVRLRLSLNPPTCPEAFFRIYTQVLSGSTLVLLCCYCYYVPVSRGTRSCLQELSAGCVGKIRVSRAWR